MDCLQLDHSAVLNMLPERKNTAHKGDFGKLLLLCGSEGYTGAASLAAMGALRTGAGLVYLGVPACIYSIEAVKLLESVVFPLPDLNGMISQTAIHKIAAHLDKMDAVLIGPGLGKSKDTRNVLFWLLNNYPGPIVIDADGTINDRFADTAKGTPMECPPPSTKDTVGFFIPAISSEMASPASTSPPTVLRMMISPSTSGDSSTATSWGIRSSYLVVLF